MFPVNNSFPGKTHFHSKKSGEKCQVKSPWQHKHKETWQCGIWQFRKTHLFHLHGPHRRLAPPILSAALLWPKLPGCFLYLRSILTDRRHSCKFFPERFLPWTTKIARIFNIYVGSPVKGNWHVICPFPPGRISAGSKSEFFISLNQISTPAGA